MSLGLLFLPLLELGDEKVKNGRRKFLSMAVQVLKLKCLQTEFYSAQQASNLECPLTADRDKVI